MTPPAPYVRRKPAPASTAEPTSAAGRATTSSALPPAPPRVYLPSAPPAPPPRRSTSSTPSPAPPVPTLHSPSGQLEMPAASYTGYSIRTKAGALWSKQVVPRMEGAALGLSRGIQDLRERREWEEHSRGVGTGGLKGKVREGTSGSPAPQSPRASGRWSSYFGSGGVSQASTPSTPDWTIEEKVVCFPGWATLRPSTFATSEPALNIEVLAHGYCYSLKPLSQASRTQRVFYSLAKSFAALPKIPANLAGASQSVESLDIGDQEGLEQIENKNDLFEQLAHMGGSNSSSSSTEALPHHPVKDELSKAAGELLIAPAIAAVVEQPLVHPPAGQEAAATSTEESPTTSTQAEAPIIDSPAKIMRRNRTSRNSSSTSLSSMNTPSRSPTASSSGTSTPPLQPNSPARPSYPSRNPTRRPTIPSSTPKPSVPKHGWPQPFTFEPSDLPRLHANLQSRLLGFFGSKLGERKLRLTVYPVLNEGQVVDTKPLASKIVTTSATGQFRAHLDVRSKSLRRLLDETGAEVGGLEGMQVRVVGELLEDERGEGVMSGGAFMGHKGLRVVAEDDAVLKVAMDGGVRCISDIDDTIKWTEVLSGTKTIFRNVFVRELQDIAVPGMADWYKAMEKLGVRFHYVSNMPQELWPTTKTYLGVHGFPSGSATLKEYGGASSALAKLWEDPGSRKRAGVESILKEFPHCRFILVGDSGEQDLNLYVSLAQQYPHQVLAIYIRDVTTPYHPDAHPDLDLDTGKPVSAEPESYASSPPGAFTGSQPPPTSTKDDLSSLPSKPPTHTHQDPKRASSTSSWLNTEHSLPLSRAPAPPLVDMETDALSPNNPLRQGSTTDTSNPDEARVELIEKFYERIRDAERTLPKEVRLTIFRHGRECRDEGVEIVREALGMHL